ncbi:MAG: HAD hydrolase-like protein [Bulleidia sp.]|nr:HAD hydrolase-like protein [Bulleidia sp.]
MNELTYLISASCLAKAMRQDSLHTLQFLKAMQDTQTPFFILSEKANTETTAQAYADFGINLPEETFMTTAMAGSKALRLKYPMKNKAACFGGDALKKTLEKDGWQISQDKADFLFLSMNRNAAYSDYCWALNVLRKGALLIVLDDALSSLNDGIWSIGTGAVAHMLEKASGKKGWHVDLPDPLLIQMCVYSMQGLYDHTVMIDNDLERGIRAGKKAGVRTVLLMDDAVTEQSAFESPVHPDAVIPNLSGLLR